MTGLVDKLKDKLTSHSSSSPDKETTSSTKMATSSLPKTYKAASFLEKGGPLTLIDVDLKEPKRGEILIKTIATGVCASDAGVQAGEFGPLPRIPGHEVIGEVVAVGEGESRWKVGDRVGAPWHGGHDNTCRQCKKGLYQMCDNEEINGVTRDGGYAEYVLLRTEAVVSIPTDVDPKQYAPLLCAGVTVFNSLRKQGISPGDYVAIQGLGGLGHLAIQYAHKQGYRVIALSSSADKEKFAKDLGAEVYIDGSKGPDDTVKQLQALGGAACIICTAGNADIINPLVNGLAPLGKLLILAPNIDKLSFSPLPLILKGLSVTGWPSGHAIDAEEAIDFAKAKDIKVITEEFTLDQAPEAYKKLMDGKMRFRGVITF